MFEKRVKSRFSLRSVWVQSNNDYTGALETIKLDESFPAEIRIVFNESIDVLFGLV